MLDLVNVGLQFGGEYLFKGIHARINAGDRISLVGANGTGKSSLMKLIMGMLPPEEGTIQKRKRLTVGYLPQENVTHAGKTLLEEAFSSLTDISLLKTKEAELTLQLEASTDDGEREDLVKQLGEIHHRLEDLDSFSATSRVEKVLIGLGFRESDFQRMTDEFSGGWQMRIALSKILISQNDLLLLDEPTNHLDLDSLRWLISYLRGFEGALLLVSHDKYFVNAVTNKTFELYLGKFSIFNGTYDAYLRFKDEREKLLETQYIQQQKKIKETMKFVERFRYKATKAKQVQSRLKQLEKMDLVELGDQKDDIVIRFPEAPGLGKSVVTLNEIDMAYGTNEIFHGLDFSVLPGDRIAFVGPNGAGKSTLAKILAGVLEQTAGERVYDPKTVLAYYAQETTDMLDTEEDILEAIEASAPTMTIGQIRSFLGSFLFSGDDVFKKVGVLSGGEKSRVALAKILLRKANFLILDEPTNHLDLSSKHVLGKALAEFKGAFVIVSHDVDFLRPLVNKIVEIVPGRVRTIVTGIDEYLAEKDFTEMQHGAAAKEKKGDEEKANRKDQKRFEAELRQKRHQETKPLTEKIKKIEDEIARLETAEKQLEAELADEKTYTNAGLAKQKTADYQNVKSKLASTMEEWELLSLQLADIEEKYNKQLIMENG